MVFFTNPVRGMKDWLPEETILFKKVCKVLEETFEDYGFEPIITPIVEYWEVLKGKYGEEAESKEIWRFRTVWSDREYGLRYDQTVPLARYFARFYNRFKLPFKRYVIDRVYRYEEPQRGRYREFWQADADIIGSSEPEADAEIINLFIDCFKRLGFKNFTVRLGDRRILAEVFEKCLRIPKDRVLEVYRIIDKLDKMGKEEVIKRLAEIVPVPREDIEELLEIRGDPYECIEKLEEKWISRELARNFLRIVDLVEDKDKVLFDLSLVRGLDYYTGMIMEVWVEGWPSSLCGGGRYDNLIGIFLNRDVPAVGASIGLMRLIDAGKALGIFKEDRKSVIDVAVIYTNMEVFDAAWKIACELRKAGVNTYVDLMKKSFRKQIEYAVNKDVSVLIIVGKRDLEEGVVTVQDRRTKEQWRVRKDAIVQKVQELLKERVCSS